jgi:hypothetical protein
MGVCKQFSFDDDIIAEKPIWVVELENGETIYQDDGRPGEAEHCSWKRLNSYLKEQKTNIKKLYLKWRNTVEYPDIPESARAYFFRNNAVRSTDEPNTQHFFIVGYIGDCAEVIHVQRWKCVGLIFDSVLPDRSIESCGSDGSIIWRNIE